MIHFIFFGLRLCSEIKQFDGSMIDVNLFNENINSLELVNKLGVKSFPIKLIFDRCDARQFQKLQSKSSVLVDINVIESEFEHHVLSKANIMVYSYCSSEKIQIIGNLVISDNIFEVLKNKRFYFNFLIDRKKSCHNVFSQIFRYDNGFVPCDKIDKTLFLFKFRPFFNIILNEMHLHENKIYKLMENYSNNKEQNLLKYSLLSSFCSIPIGIKKEMTKADLNSIFEYLYNCLKENMKVHVSQESSIGSTSNTPTGDHSVTGARNSMQLKEVKPGPPNQPKAIRFEDKQERPLINEGINDLQDKKITIGAVKSLDGESSIEETKAVVILPSNEKPTETVGGDEDARPPKKEPIIETSLLKNDEKEKHASTKVDDTQEESDLEKDVSIKQKQTEDAILEAGTIPEEKANGETTMKDEEKPKVNLKDTEIKDESLRKEETVKTTEELYIEIKPMLEKETPPREVTKRSSSQDNLLLNEQSVNPVGSKEIHGQEYGVLDDSSFVEDTSLEEEQKQTAHYRNYLTFEPLSFLSVKENSNAQIQKIDKVQLTDDEYLVYFQKNSKHICEVLLEILYDLKLTGGRDEKWFSILNINLVISEEQPTQDKKLLVFKTKTLPFSKNKPNNMNVFVYHTAPNIHPISNSTDYEILPSEEIEFCDFYDDQVFICLATRLIRKRNVLFVADRKKTALNYYQKNFNDNN